MNERLCPGCGLRWLHCVCDLLEPVPARTPMLVIRHTSERFKSSNTGILLPRLLPNCQLIEYGLPGEPFDPAELCRSNLVLVFPGPPEPLPEHPTLLLLDATWAQARRMLHRLPGAATLPRLSLPPAPQRLRMRRSPHEDGMSTLEAAAMALSLVEDPSLADPLFRLYDRMAERQLRQRGRLGSPYIESPRT